MISKQILQNTIDELTGITRIDLCIINVEGKVLAATFPEADQYIEPAQAFVESPADSQVVQGHQFFKIYDELQVEYVLVAKGSSDDVYMIGKMAAFQIQNLLVAYKERFDKDNFIKNLLLDNLLLVDIYNRAKKLHIAANARRVVFLVDTAQEKDNASMECIRSLLGTKTGDFITAVDEKSIIVVKELASEEGYQEMEKTAKQILNVLPAEKQEVSHIAYGTIVEEIKEVSRSYKEARMAMDVGRIFFEEKNIIAYSSLGIGRLIYQLPMSLCEMFIHEVFGDEVPDIFNEEINTTIQKFFENNLNISETARQLYVHRNTLVYRLERLEKAIGLDIRKFDDAMTFKIAMMVIAHMNQQKVEE